MWEALGQICIFVLLLLGTMLLARKNGEKSAKLEALQAKEKERQRKNEIMDNVRNMATDDVYSRLSNINRD